MLSTLQDKFYNNFIADERWRYIAEGLGVTLQVTFFAVIDVYKRQNRDIVRIYDEYLEKPNSHKAHMLLHTEHIKE